MLRNLNEIVRSWIRLLGNEQSTAGLVVISSLVVGMDPSEGGREGQGPGPDSGAGVGSVAGGVGQKVRSP